MARLHQGGTTEGRRGIGDGGVTDEERVRVRRFTFGRQGDPRGTEFLQLFASVIEAIFSAKMTSSEWRRGRTGAAPTPRMRRGWARRTFQFGRVVGYPLSDPRAGANTAFSQEAVATGFGKEATLAYPPTASSGASPPASSP